MWLGVGPTVRTWPLPSGGGTGLTLERERHCLLDPAVLLGVYMLSESPRSPPLLTHLAHFRHAVRNTGE